MRATADELTQAIGFQATTMAAPLEEGEWDTQMEAILTAVSNTIDAMIRPRIDPSTVPTDPILKRICLSIAVYDVWLQFARNQVPESVRLDKEEAMKTLEKIQRGSLELIPSGSEVEPIAAEFSSKAQALGTDL
jgi:phage gp36-like protein